MCIKFCLIELLEREHSEQCLLLSLYVIGMLLDNDLENIQSGVCFKFYTFVVVGNWRVTRQ